MSNQEILLMDEVVRLTVENLRLRGELTQARSRVFGASIPSVTSLKSAANCRSHEPACLLDPCIDCELFYD